MPAAIRVRAHGVLTIAKTQEGPKPPVSKQPTLDEGEGLCAGHDDVIDDPHVHHRQRGREGLGQQLVRTRRLEVSGWMIMRYN